MISEKTKKGCEISVDNTYDLFVSLGGSCISTQQLRRKKLQYLSLPFDWLYNNNTNIMYSISKLFEEDFALWLDRKNMQNIPNPNLQEKSLQYKDKETGYVYIHDFFVSIDHELEYFSVRNKYQRRIQRLIKSITKSDRILFVLDMLHEIPIADIEHFLDVMNRKFPSKIFDFVFFNFESNTPQEGLVEQNEHMKIYKWNRSKTYEDHNKDPKEWEFLREYSLSEYGKKFIHKQDTLNKLLNKISQIIYFKKIQKGFIVHFLQKRRPRLYLYTKFGFRMIIIVGRLAERYIDNDWF